MKLKLEAVRDLSVLIVEGPITPENFAVLRAGIKKLFKDGKNKIILELPDSGALAATILRELATLNLLAAELSGSIVLAKIEPLTRAKIESFSKPPVVTCFSDRVAATEHFHPKVVEETTAAAPAAAPAPTSSPVAAAPPLPETSTSEIDEKTKLLKTEIRTKELGDLGAVRKKLSELESENNELKTRLAEMVLIRREPPDLGAWKEKVAVLEKQLADAVKVAQDAAATKK